MEQERSIRELINQYENDICYYQQMQIYSMSTYEKNYYAKQIKQKSNCLITELEKLLQRRNLSNQKIRKEGNYTIKHNFDDDYEEVGRIEKNSDEKHFYGNPSRNLDDEVLKTAKTNLEKEIILQSDSNYEKEFIISPEPNIVNEFYIRPDSEEGNDINLSQEDQIINTEPQVEVIPGSDIIPPTERTFTVEELAKYDGTNGNPPYVAVKGIVYDMSAIPPWETGNHFGLKAGKDLTTQFMACHRGAQAVIDKLIPVGKLVT